MNIYRLISVFFLFQILMGCSSDQQVGLIGKIGANRSTAGLTDVSIPKVDPSTLSPKGQIAYQLFSQMDMTSPTLADCLTKLNAGNWEEALDTWRDITVMKFRRRDFGYFGWHDYVIFNPAPRNVIKAMIGITPTETVLQNYANFNDFRGIRRFMTGESARINWYATAPSGTTDLFEWLSSWKGWAGAYWQEGNVTYINKFFDLYVQVFTEAPALWWQLYREKLDGANNGFTFNAINNMTWNENLNHLALGVEVNALLKNIAGFTKSLSADKPTNSNLLLAPLSTSPSPSEMAVIDSGKLAKIVLGINQNAIGPMIYFSYYPGSVPNQRSEDIKAIALFNQIFGEFKKVPNLAIKYNQQVMPGYLVENFLPDGTSLEQSLNYNKGEIDFLNELANFYTVSDNITYLDKLPLIIAARSAVDKGLMMPLGNLPQIGNNAGFSTFRDLWSNPTYATSFLNSVAKSVTPQSYLSKEFPYAGYFAQRDGWGAKDRYLFFYNNRPQRGHYMRGTLSIQMAAYGRQMVVTGGEPTYGQYVSGQDGSDAKGADFFLSEQSTLKTNSVLVDGKQQAWNATVLTASPQTTVGAKFSTTETFDFVDGTYRLGYASDGLKKDLDMSTTHYRNVVFIKPLKLWLLVDQMSVAAGTIASKNFTQVWNFPPFYQAASIDKTIYGFASDQFTIDQTNRNFATTDSKAPNVEFRHFGPTSLSYSSYYGDRTNWLGWSGTSIGAAKPAMNIHTKWSSNELKPLLTLMIPKDVGQASPVTTVTEYTGSATVSGFDALFANSSTLSTRTAPASETLTIGNIVVNGSYLTLLTRPDQQQSGIVMGASSMKISGVNSVIPGSDFSFIIQNGEVTTTSIEATQATVQSNLRV